MGSLSNEEQKLVLWGNELAELAYKGVDRDAKASDLSCEHPGTYSVSVLAENNIQLTHTVKPDWGCDPFCPHGTNFMIGGVVSSVLPLVCL